MVQHNMENHRDALCQFWPEADTEHSNTQAMICTLRFTLYTGSLFAFLICYWY